MRVSPRLPWYCLLAAVVLVPVAVGVLPLSGFRLTLNVFVQAKLIVLALAIGLTLGSWTALSLKNGPLYSGRALFPLAVFIAVATASAMFGIDRRIALFGDFEQGVGLLVLMLCTLTAFLVTQLVRGETTLHTLTSAVIFTAAGIAAIGLVQQLLGVDMLGVFGAWTEEKPTYLLLRGFGTIGNPDTYAAYLAIPVVLAFSRVRRATTRREVTIRGSCLVVILASFVAAQTRGALIGVALGLASYEYAERILARRVGQAGHKRQGTTRPARQTWLLLASGVGLGVVLAVALSGGNQWAATYADFSKRFLNVEAYTSLGGRIPLWVAAVRIMAAHPLLGVGPDSFRLGWYPVRELSTVSSAGLVITDPHSLPLLIGSTMGVAGLLAALYLSASTLRTGLRTIQQPAVSRESGADYRAWLAATLALLITMLASLSSISIMFALFVGFGVLIAPSLSQIAPVKKTSIMTALRITCSLLAFALVAFSLLTATAQLTAARVELKDDRAAAAQADRAFSLSPWDSGIRNLRHQTMVQAALQKVFTDAPDAVASVTAAEQDLARAEQREPHEYLHPYRSALLLIGAGQKLGAPFTLRGIQAGKRGLSLYPNSIELRTGVASGLLSVGRFIEARTLLDGYWDRDPQYLSAGLTYGRALADVGSTREARRVASVLKRRFPDDASVNELLGQLSK